MLNYNTLLSSYDDKLTLMQWLKKVEDALKDASAVSFNVNQRGNATLTFSVVFEDGSELETGPIVLQQGESVQSAAIVNGHLILTLTNGDTLDAGDLGGVSSFSIDGSQHLIVHYQNGTTQDLGAIFNGNVNITGNVTASKFIGDTALESIKDASGNNRFIGGDLNENVTSGITHIYKKWSLSGTHLMIVDVFKIANGTSLTSYTMPAELALPAWVGAKLQPIGTTSDWIVFKSALISKANGAPATEASSTLFRKLSNTYFQLYLTDPITASEDIYVRLQFDLLVDNE